MGTVFTSLHLQHFRSYVDSTFEFNKGVNIIVGPNASGKTNLLEGLLMVARGGSYRGRDVEMISFEAPWARLQAETSQGARIVKIQREAQDRSSKTFVIDEQSLSRITLQRGVPIVLFEPNDLQLLTGSPELRRLFLDDLIEQTIPHFGALRRHYKRVVTQRNTLLKKQPRDIAEQLFVWNIRLSELGGQIARERIELIGQLNAQISELYDTIAAGGQTIELTYTTQFPYDNYETALLHKLELSTEIDVLRGFTAYGPHRDDLGVLIDNRKADVVASRGETRTLVLALKILELQLLEKLRGERPLLLLDDVFSELDSKRRQALTGFVSSYQTFLTTTDADIILQHFADSSVIRVAN